MIHTRSSDASFPRTRQANRPRLISLAVRAALLGLPLLAVLPDALPTAQAAETVALRSYDIPAGPLAGALVRFAEQAGIQLSVDAGLTGDLGSPGVRGQHSMASALAALLAGTGLEAVNRGGNEYTLQKVKLPARQGEAMLAPMTVTAAGLPDASTEGTGSYTLAGPVGTGTPLGLTIKETPQSVSVVTRQQMEDLGMTTVSDILAQAPGTTQVSQGTERISFTSRGYEIANYQLDGANTHSEILGGASIAPQTLTDMAIYDRVEILRGASGLMTGAGNPSGAINLVRKKPTAEFQGSVEGSVGSWNDLRGVLDLSGPINESRSVRSRLVVVGQDHDSFIDYYSRSKKQLYGVLEADLADTTRLTLGIDHQKAKSKGSAAYAGLPLWYSNGQQTDLPVSFSVSSRDNRFEVESTSAFMTLEHDFGNEWKAKFSATHLRSSQLEDAVHMDLQYGFADQFTGDGFKLGAYRRDYKQRISSVDFNVQGPLALFGRRHEAVFGLDYNNFKSPAAYRNNDSSGLHGSPVNLYTWDRSGVAIYGTQTGGYESYRRQTSLYGAGRFELADRLKLIAGAKVFNYDANTLTYNIWGYYAAPSTSEKRVVTPYGGLVYDINDVHTVYASYTSIYQPQFQQNRGGALLDPREGVNYELGLKSGWLGGKLNTAVGLYQIRQDNLAVYDAGYSVPGTTNPAYQAVKGAKTQGVDVEISGSITPSWNMSASWSYGQTENADGRRITTTFPRHLVKLWATYRLPGEWNRLTVGGGANWQSKVYSTVNAWRIGRDLYWEQEAYTVVNLMARYDFSKQLSATLNVNNVFDKKYIASVMDAWYQGVYGAPRSVALSLRYKF